ncbi:hypothetical protein ZIOFF_039541 [Zingiber officinale]|uniref:Uncharacterized protein n=1 Tax=Zingiber officinale TaxID=94328 RepID=A0A8J5KX96_ZINOF|nr:hypothetical protein ZIOFF_039541 [Zingiber officinale]
MSETWEKAIQDWYENSCTSNLEYLDLASTPKVTNNQLAHNLATIYDKTCLSSCVHLKNCKLIIEQTQLLKKEVLKLETALSNLTLVYTENKPLTKQEVRNHVKDVTGNPKLVEEEALTLTEELNKKLERIDELLKDIQADLKTVVEQTKGGIKATSLPDDLITKLQILSLGPAERPKEGKGKLRISIQTRGYDQWQHSKANLLITRDMVRQLSNTPNVGFAYEIQGVVEYLTSHDPSEVNTRNLMYGRISLSFNNYLASSLVQIASYNSKDKEIQSDDEKFHTLAVLVRQTLDDPAYGEGDDYYEVVQDTETQPFVLVHKISPYVVIPQQKSTNAVSFDLVANEPCIIKARGRGKFSNAFLWNPIWQLWPNCHQIKRRLEPGP